MKNYTENDVAADLNNLIKFLSRRDISELSCGALSAAYGLSQADMLIVLGSSMPYLAELGADAVKRGVAKTLMIVGGIGHSTKYLVENICNSKEYKDIEVENRPEADILKDVIVKSLDSVHANNILIENNSTNCGENASEALKIIKKQGEVPSSVIIIQDPTMQLRTHASFLKAWEGERTEIISFSPFIPEVNIKDGILKLQNDIFGIWSFDRFIDLVMGEIPRLKDDENGYGPKGKGFIAHVEIPEDVLASYNRMQERFEGYKSIKFRK